MHGIRSFAFSLVWRCKVQRHLPVAYLAIRISLQNLNYFRRQLFWRAITASLHETDYIQTRRINAFRPEKGAQVENQLRLPSWKAWRTKFSYSPKPVQSMDLYVGSHSLWPLKWNDDEMNSIKILQSYGCWLAALVEQVSHVQRLCTLPIWVRLPVWDPLLRVTPPLYLILFPAQVFSSSINKAKKKKKKSTDNQQLLHEHLWIVAIRVLWEQWRRPVGVPCWFMDLSGRQIPVASPLK